MLPKPTGFSVCSWATRFLPARSSSPPTRRLLHWTYNQNMPESVCPKASELQQRGLACPMGFEPKEGKPDATLTWKEHQKLSAISQLRARLKEAHDQYPEIGILSVCFFCHQ